MRIGIYFLIILFLFLATGLSVASEKQDQVDPPGTGDVLVEYNNAQNQTWISSKAVSLPLDSSDEIKKLELIGFYVIQGKQLVVPNEIYIEVLIEPCIDSIELKIWTDGKLLSRVTGSTPCIAEGGKTTGMFSVPMSYNEFLSFPKAKEIKIEIGKREFRLSDDQKRPFLQLGHYVSKPK